MTKNNALNRFTLLKDLVHLVYPSLCLVCENELSITEKHVCSICHNDLTFTSFHLFNEPTAVDKLFWGRVEIKQTYSHLFYKRNASSQKVLFNLKYKNNSVIGEYFGKEIGTRIKQVEGYKNADLIIPVPLHYKKQFIRGYNQSFALAKGLGEELSIPVNQSLSKRNEHTSTQTKKGRFERWDNVNSIFSIHPSIKKYKHVILVDDVITTGSTMEALIQSIQSCAPEIEISVVTLAIA